MLSSMDGLIRKENGQFAPGTIGGPGRPKGSTLKEYQAARFRMMSDEEKEEYLKDVAKMEKWRMAEGNPAQDNTLDVTGDVTITFDNAFASTPEDNRQ